MYKHTQVDKITKKTTEKTEEKLTKKEIIEFSIS